MPAIALTLTILPTGAAPISDGGPFSFTLERTGAAAGVLTIPIVNRGPESFAVSQAQENWVTQRYPDLEMCFAGAWRTSDAARFAEITADLGSLAEGPATDALWLLSDLRTRYVVQPRAPNGCPLWSPRADVDDAVRQAARVEDLKDHRRLLDMAPELAEAWLLRASRRHIEHEDYEGALADCRQAAVLDPLAVAAWHGQGWALVAMQRWAEAVAAFEQALQLPTGHRDTRVGLAYALEKSGDFELAAQQLLQAAPPASAGSRHAGDYLLHLSRARCLGAMQKHEEALDALASALRCQPNQSTPSLERGRLLLTLGRLPEALQAAVEACDVALAWEFEPLLLRGSLLRAAGKQAEALVQFEKVKERAPEELRLCGERGAALADLSRCEEALPDLDRYLAEASWWPANLARATCRWRLCGDRDGALADLAVVQAAVPDHAEALALRDQITAAGHSVVEP